MAQFTWVIGIDVSKDRLDVCLLPTNARLQVANDADGWALLRDWASQSPIERIGLEATGGYEQGVAKALAAAGLCVVIHDPYRVRLFAKAMGKRAKNDVIDAAAIAHFTALSDGDIYRDDPERRKLGELCKLRDTLIETRIKISNASRQYESPEAREMAARHVEVLDKDIKALERLMTAFLDNSEELAESVGILRSVPGVGDLSVAILIAFVPELGHTSRHHIAALIGVAPYDADSGDTQGIRHIGGGRSHVRRGLYMATLAAAVRHNEVLKVFYKRLKNNGKKGKVALIACMRKLLTILNAMMKHRRRWNEQTT